MSGGVANLGPGLTLKGELTGQEIVYLDCKVEGPVNFGGNRVTIGRSSVVEGDIVAREAVLHGKLSGDLRAHDRVEVKKGGSLVGDLVTGRISIEEGAYLKGHIEVDEQQATEGDLGVDSAPRRKSIIEFRGASGRHSCLCGFRLLRRCESQAGVPALPFYAAEFAARCTRRQPK